jgi:hypothetical protein
VPTTTCNPLQLPTGPGLGDPNWTGATPFAAGSPSYACPAPPSHVFVYSNRPETIPDLQAPKTLWMSQHTVLQGQTPQFRVWWWHLNSTGQAIKFGVTIESLNTDLGQHLTIPTGSWYLGATGGGMTQGFAAQDLLGLGTCVAFQQLDRSSLQGMGISNPNIGIGPTMINPGLVSQFGNLPANATTGGFMEFQVTPLLPQVDFILRFVYGLPTDVLRLNADVAPKNGTTGDGRGTWVFGNSSGSYWTAPYVARTAPQYVTVASALGGQPPPWDGCWLASNSLNSA